MADQLRQRIELEVGVPVTVAFSFDAGRLCSKRWPGAEDTYARQTTDGRVLFVDATEEMRLRKVARTGQPVILCREKTKSGARYLTVKEPAPQLKSPLGVVNGGIIPDAKYASIEPPAPVWDNVALVHLAELSRIVPSSASDQASTMPNGVSHTEIIMQSADGGLLGRCLCEALDACKVAHAHASAIGLPTTFGPGEVERMAVSIFIERTRNGSVVDRKSNGRAGYQNGHATAGA